MFFIPHLELQCGMVMYGFASGTAGWGRQPELRVRS